MPKLFNVLADLLEWILLSQGVPVLMHYLDNYLTMGPPNTEICNQSLQRLIDVCAMLGIPLAAEKVEGPSATIEFLGIQLDTVRMEARLSTEKLTRICTVIQDWRLKRNATKREILFLVGLLQHAAKAVRPGRIFVRRMYSKAAKLQEMEHFTRLNKEFWSDLQWWHTFLTDWNGVALLPPPRKPSLTVQTDASGSWGCAGILAARWFQFQWPQDWSPIAIMAKEMVPIVISCAITCMGGQCFFNATTKGW